MAYVKYSEKLQSWAKKRGCSLEIAYVIETLAEGCDMSAHEIWRYQTSLTEWAVRGLLTELVRQGHLPERESYVWEPSLDPFRLFHTPSRWYEYGYVNPDPKPSSN